MVERSEGRVKLQESQKKFDGRDTKDEAWRMHRVSPGRVTGLEDVKGGIVYLDQEVCVEKPARHGAIHKVYTDWCSGETH